jgi:Flp pilus assembly protein CpaB
LIDSNARQEQASCRCLGPLEGPRTVMNPTRFLLNLIIAVAFCVLLSCSGMQTGMQTTRIPRGMRAVAVRVNWVPGIVPGARVDILVTDNPAGSAESHTATVLQGVEVLALEQLKTEHGGVVTVLTSPKDAEKLALASQKGRISLVPRN